MMITRICWLSAFAAAYAARIAHVVHLADSDQLIQFASRELTRYTYLIDHLHVYHIVDTVHDFDSVPISRNGITVFIANTSQDTGSKSGCLSTSNQAYCIDTCTNVHTIIGTTSLSAIWGVYDYLSQMGLHFSSAGVLLPTATLDTAVDSNVSLAAEPIFDSVRGLQPFHDFSEGPDWWSADEHKRVLETILQMRGNVIAFHTYPVGELAEPTAWFGLKDNVNPDGTVTSGYSTTWSNTYRTAWGYTPANTSSFPFGANVLYDTECFGHPVQSGKANLCPAPVTPADEILLFNEVGQLWQDTFAFAHKIGVKTILGTEMPLTQPPLPSGLLTPLMVWYSASRNDHFVTTTSCDECEGLYSLQGVIGFVYTDNTSVPGLIPLSTYYSGAYADNILTSGAPPDGTYGFVRVEGYALPPESAGPNSTQLLQSVNGHHHFAVAGATWIANATIEGFTVESPFATIWTTGPPLPSTQDWYEGAFLRLNNLLGDNLDWYWVWTPEAWEWDSVNISNPLIQDAVADALAIDAAHQAVSAKFQLASCGWVIGPLGARWYFDTVLPSNWSMSSIDMDVGNTPIDPAYANITHRIAENKWVIPWAEDDPGLTAPELWLNRTLLHAQEAVSYGVAGMMMIHWRTRATSAQISAIHAWAWDQTITSESYWVTWATAQFGQDAGPQAATIFSAVESFNLPRPVNWLNGPGGMQADSTQCNFVVTYSWVDTFLALRQLVVAAFDAGTATPANLESFDYWGYQFSFMRKIARFECDWNTYDAVVTYVQGITDPTARKAAAISLAIPARVSLVQNITDMMGDMLASTTGIEGMGTIHNIITHSLINAIGIVPTQLLESLAGESLPAGAFPPMSFDALRPPMLRVPTVRTVLAQGEPFNMRATVLTSTEQAPTNVTLFWRPIGNSTYASRTMQGAGTVGGVNRFVFTTSLPGPAADFEYFVQASLPANRTAYTHGLGIPAGTQFTANAVNLFFPPGAPNIPQTVVLV